ncbi:hypothetical protein SISNIDRAFT_458476 [Sistotremastrum niveocremeum HHB9708]|uniref:F-box domain-containing protein n=1 Tax=Sistotremastrum niveocremeum HHB9708 TaxID=1314777 RepID=A0A164QM17_9AGAM|nr:hypothetical protein SISNIDRAFT_458476 [Sistotremastrum niveocremeum HHB9708]
MAPRHSLYEFVRYSINSLLSPSRDPTRYLPTDVLIEICQLLSVYDVLALRRVNRTFYRLTHEPIIWKQLLLNSKFRPPQLPPTPSHSLGVIEQSAAELALRRAYTLEMEWKHDSTCACHTQFDSFGKVFKMSIVPGGKYLVSTLLDDQSQQICLSLWDLDHKRGDFSEAPLAKTMLGQEVMEMKSRYMSVRGIKGIVIALLMKVEDSKNKTMTSVLFVPLKPLEDFALLRRSAGVNQAEAANLATSQSPPFINIYTRDASSRVEGLTLEMMGGVPYLGLIKDAKTVVLQSLETGLRTFITPHDPLVEHNPSLQCICRAIKIFPAQRQVLVIRELRLRGERYMKYWIEFFDIPLSHGKFTESMSTYKQVVAAVHIKTFHITDDVYHDDIHLYDDSVNALVAPRHKPPPVSIFCGVSRTSTEPTQQGLLVVRLEPEAYTSHMTLDGSKSSQGRLSYRYVVIPDNIWFSTHRRHHIVLGGAQRSLWISDLDPSEPSKDGTKAPPPKSISEYGDPWRLRHIVRYFPAKFTPGMSADEVAKEQARAAKLVKFHPVVEKDMKEGVCAIAFDESIGRLCVAVRGGRVVHVMDYGEDMDLLPELQAFYTKMDTDEKADLLATAMEQD